MGRETTKVLQPQSKRLDTCGRGLRTKNNAAPFGQSREFQRKTGREI